MGRAAVATLLALLGLLRISPAAATDAILAAAFSAEAPGAPLPALWQPLLFRNIPRHTRYALVSQDGVTVLEAHAESSASGVARPLDIDPKRYPVLRWRWKVANLIGKADPTRKSGDDYPARLYITFRRDPSAAGALDRAWSALSRLALWAAP